MHSYEYDLVTRRQDACGPVTAGDPPAVPAIADLALGPRPECTFS